MTVTTPEWELQVIDQSDLDTVIASVTSDETTAEGKPVLSHDGTVFKNTPGKISLSLPNTADLLIELLPDRLVRVLLRGAPADTFIIEPPSRQLVAPAGEKAENATVTGPGWLAKIAEGVVLPGNGLDAQPKQIDRPFNCTALEYDDSGWDDPFDVGVYTPGDPVLGFPVSDWWDPTAHHIFTDDYDVDDFTAPSGFRWARKEFTVDHDLILGIQNAGDDRTRLWVDGMLLLSSENNGLNGATPSAMQPATRTLFLTAGTHVVVVEVVNYWKEPGLPYDIDPTPGTPDTYPLNPGSVIAAAFEMVGPKLDERGDLIFHTDDTWKIIHADSMPGMTPGHAIRVVVEELQALGYLLGLVLGFTDTEDSAGTPWAADGNLATKVGYTVLQFVQELCGTYIDVRMRPDELVLDAWVKDTNGATSGVSLHLPDSVDEPETQTLQLLATKGTRKLADGVLGSWPSGWHLAEDPTDGVHKMVSLGFGTAQSIDEVQRLAAGQLDVYKQERTSVTAKQTVWAGLDDTQYPFLAYREMDTVTVTHDGLGGEVEVEVLSVAWRLDPETGIVDFTLELGDHIPTAEERFALTAGKFSSGLAGGTSAVATPNALVQSPQPIPLIAPSSGGSAWAARRDDSITLPGSSDAIVSWENTDEFNFVSVSGAAFEWPFSDPDAQGLGSDDNTKIALLEPGIYSIAGGAKAAGSGFTIYGFIRASGPPAGYLAQEAQNRSDFTKVTVCETIVVVDVPHVVQLIVGTSSATDKTGSSFHLGIAKVASL